MKIPVANVWFDNVTMAEAVDRIVDYARRNDRSRYVCTGNLDHLAMLERDGEFAQVYREADIVLADGAPVLWLSKRSCPESPLRERVAGSDLFWELAHASQTHGLRLFFLGGRPGAAERAADAVKARYPGAIICGMHCPPHDSFDTAEVQRRILGEIRASSPDIVFVAFGAPKQEKWIHKNLDRLGVPVSIGVGGTLEMAGGNVRRAPIWMRQVGLEWAFRFIQEPMRLFRRYFLTDIPFLLRAYVRELTGAHRGARRTVASAGTMIDAAASNLDGSPSTAAPSGTIAPSFGSTAAEPATSAAAE